MFSLKSEALQRWLRLHLQKGLVCAAVNWDKDTRYGSGVLSTHKNVLGDQTQMRAICTNDLESIRDELMHADVIGIDEIQFFPNCVQLVRDLLKAGKDIFIVGLDSDFNQKPFPGSCLSELIPLAHRVEKFLAVCDFCTGKRPEMAPMSWRTSSETETVVVGGPEKYGAICHNCRENGRFTRRSDLLKKRVGDEAV